jgi:hypothetical protein
MNINFKRAFALPFNTKKSLYSVLIYSIIIFSGIMAEIIILKLFGNDISTKLSAFFISFLFYLIPLVYLIILAQQFIYSHDNFIPDIPFNFLNYLFVGLKSLIATIFYTIAIFIFCLVLFLLIIVPAYLLLSVFSLNKALDFINDKIQIIIGSVSIIILFIAISVEAFISVVFADSKR